MPDRHRDPSPAVLRVLCRSESWACLPWLRVPAGSLRDSRRCPRLWCKCGYALMAPRGAAGRGAVLWRAVCLVDDRLSDGGEGCGPRVLSAPDLHTPWLGC